MKVVFLPLKPLYCNMYTLLISPPFPKIFLSFHTTLSLSLTLSHTLFPPGKTKIIFITIRYRKLENCCHFPDNIIDR